MLRRIKTSLRFLAGTPLHPQWLTRTGQADLVALIATHARGDVLDVGCFDKWPKRHLPASSNYIGLDYYATAVDWYASRPDVFGDGCRLPIADAAVDAVLLLDVLEHVPDTAALLGEIRRVLVPGGHLVMRVPFLYPLHDEPRDFVRFTEHGFRRLAETHGLECRDVRAVGHPVESAALLLNVALAKTALGWIAARNPLALAVVLVPPIVLVANLLARLVAAIARADGFMPLSYHVVLERPAAEAGA